MNNVMDRTQQYVMTLLDKIPSSGLDDAGHRDAFGRIKNVLGEAPDLKAHLRSLYKVSNFAEFALSLMWIAERVEHDPSKLESTADEERLVARLLSTAFGESPSVQGAFASAVAEDPFGFGPAQASEETGSGTVEQASAPETSTQAPPPADVAGILSGAPASAAGPGGHEQDFASTLEKLVEAIQSGSDDRGALLDQLTSQAEQVVSRPDAGDDFKAFCGYMTEFLKYVSANQLFDDIRVMNMMSNAFDPFSQWVKADPSARAGLLDQPNEVLREFKSLFE